jgi:S-DNA-T family DNA segregation ATPase FtsK/SpoIIIE
MSKKKKAKKKNIKSTPSKSRVSLPLEDPPHEKYTEITGFLTLTLAVVLTLSLVSFAYGHTSDNWLGVIGYTLGWVMHTTLGITSYFAVGFLVWLGAHWLFDKPIKGLQLKSIYFSVLVLSSAILLSMIEDQYPSFGGGISNLFYPPQARYKIPYHIGGLPIFYLYKEIPVINLLTVFNALGVMIIFSSLLIASCLFLFNIPLSDAFRWVLKKLKRAKPPEPEPAVVTVIDEPRPIKIRLPKLIRDTPPEPIEAESTPQPPAPAKPKRLLDPIKPTLGDNTSKPKATKRDKALQEQRAWNGDYKAMKLPPTKLLAPPKHVDQSSLKRDLRTQAQTLEETLGSFGIEAKVGQINCGPTIISFEVHPAVGVKVQRIKALENDIALNMQAASIRIIAPIPGKAAVGVEVPNPFPQEVSFREMLSAYQSQEKKFKIPLLLGKSVSGEYVMSDLTKMPHMIIAGATGSGKSVCINTIVMSILYCARPDEIQLLMIDPKKVELTPYTSLPHMIAPVITSPHEAYTAMQWLVKEMEKRYEILNKLHLRNIDSFNSRTPDLEKEAELPIDIPEKLPYIVGIVDELADLMMVSTHDIETPIARIAQMARAVGIHLILATQRPSREVITGLIKANFPTRVCFKVSSGINSKIVLDATGGEQLLGNGDMLFLPPGTANLERVQGAFICDDDILHVIESITSQAPPNYRIPSFAHISDSGEQDLFDPRPSDRDVLYDKAVETVISTGNASTTFLQRKLKVGYARAASLMDQLEENGIVSPQEGSKARTVLVSTPPGD